MKPVLSKFFIGVAATLCLAATSVQAQSVLDAQASVASSAAATAGGPATVRVNVAGGGASQSLALPQGKSAVVDLPVDARDVLVSNPGVADVVLRSPRRISVIGMKEGSTDAVFFDASGRRILSLSIHVDVDTVAISDAVNRILPGSHVHAEGIAGSVILSGQVASLSDADKAVQIPRAPVSRPPQG